MNRLYLSALLLLTSPVAVFAQAEWESAIVLSRRQAKACIWGNSMSHTIFNKNML